jgi:hypothetical protein
MTVTNGGGDTEALRREIARTRAELGETVQALAAKADVKARAREQVEQTKDRVRERVAQFAGTARSSARTSAHDAGVAARRNPVPLGALLGAAAALVVVLIVIRGRNNR